MPAPSEFYKRFKDNPEAAQQEAFRIGEAIGLALMRELNVVGDDLQSIVKVVNAFAQQGSTLTSIQGDKAIITNRAFCPIMASALMLNIPWKWLCPNFGWPIMKGIAHAVNPKADMKPGSWRAEGGSLCEHFFEIS